MLAELLKALPPSAALALGLAGSVATDPDDARRQAEFRRSAADLDEAARLLEGARATLERLRKEPPTPGHPFP
jgi:hypothetical protein